MNQRSGNQMSGGKRPGETRIPIFAPHFSPMQLIRNIGKFATGTLGVAEFGQILRGKLNLNALTFAPLKVHEHRASLWVGPQGLALRGMTRHHDFELPWHEVAEVQVVWSCNLVMRVDSVVLVLVPTAEDPLASAPGGLANYLNAETAHFELTLYMDQQVPVTYREQVVEALRPYAGARLVE